MHAIAAERRRKQIMTSQDPSPNDKPITQPDEDRFGMDTFAQALAAAGAIRERDRERLRRALMRLFPRLESIWGNLHYGEHSVTCHCVFPPDGARVRPEEGRKDEASKVHGRADYHGAEGA